MRLNLSAPVTVAATSADGTSPRRLDGVAVPWNVTANASTGKVMFLEGSLPTDGPAPKLIRDHDLSQPIGIVNERVSTSEGMMFSARISQTAAGDEALVLASDGVLDAVSVGVEATDFSWEDGTLVVKAGRWMELSLVPFGAFPEARVAQVAASEMEPVPDEPETNNPETVNTEPSEEAPAMETANAAAAIPTAPIQIHAAPRIPTAAEWIAAAKDPAKLAQYATVLAADTGTSSLPGILPEPIIQPIYDAMLADRPLANYFGVRALPSTFGKIFSRPYIDTHTSVDVQENEFDTLDSQSLVVDSISFTKELVGGYARLSEQAIDWTDPTSINVVLSDLAKVYARRTEVIVSDLISTVSVGSPIAQSPAGLLGFVYDGATTMAGSNYGQLPDALIVSLEAWAIMGKLADNNDRPIFPSIAPSNAPGMMMANTYNGNPFGLQIVVSSNLASGRMYLTRREAVEVYEQQKGSLSVDEPATASRIVSFRGYFTTNFINSNMVIGGTF